MQGTTTVVSTKRPCSVALIVVLSIMGVFWVIGIACIAAGYSNATKCVQTYLDSTDPNSLNEEVDCLHQAVVVYVVGYIFCVVAAILSFVSCCLCCGVCCGRNSVVIVQQGQQQPMGMGVVTVQTQGGYGPPGGYVVQAQPMSIQQGQPVQQGETTEGYPSS